MIPRFKSILGWPELKCVFSMKHGSIEKFQNKISSFFNVEDSIIFPYGRSALWAFFKALNLNNSEIILPAYTCSTVAHSIKLSNNIPIFVDIELNTYNMCLNQLRQKITSKTKAIIITHIFGYGMDLEKINVIVKNAEMQFDNKIWIIQDCAHSFNTHSNGKSVFKFGDVSLLSLNASKMLTSVFGGVLLFNSTNLSKKIKVFKAKHFIKPNIYTQLKRRVYFICLYLAFTRLIYPITWFLQKKTNLLKKFTDSYHLENEVVFPPDYLVEMLSFQAEIGTKQIDRYNEIIISRQRNAKFYNKHIKIKKGWHLPPIIDGSTYSHYSIFVPNKKEIEFKLASEGIEVGEIIQYCIPTKYPCYNDNMKYINANLASNNIVNLPVGSHIKNKDREKIVKVVNSL